ncbi:hypothetical protein [Neolewinella agarilytica]|uniref:hypothetical protein n=1 Tax=Neolewinella agarilytica TaxID=478744 RepID=UPI0023559C93|nr:hypothetical protein [Neolewinella agarilytica]
MSKNPSKYPKPEMAIKDGETQRHVWAPNAKAVALLNEFNDWEEVGPDFQETQHAFWSGSINQLDTDDEL